MISLIMRVQDRLEMTQRCLRGLAYQEGAPPFEVVVVDNGSTDGTHEWFTWVMCHRVRDWYPPIRYLHPGRNTGDWGGMQYGWPYVSEQAAVVGQLDNDIYLPPTGLACAWHVLRSGGADVAMLKRNGVKNAIQTTSGVRKADLGGGRRLELVDVKFCVAFWIARRESFAKHAATSAHCRQFTERCGRCVKVLNVQAEHMDGWVEGGPDYYLQLQKYPKDERR